MFSPKKALVALVLALALAVPMAAQAGDAVVLPSRVQTAITRAQAALNTAVTAVVQGKSADAVASLLDFRLSLYKAQDAAIREMSAVPADPEAETTSGPDSVLAVLDLEHTAFTTVAGLFDGQCCLKINGLTRTIFRTLEVRDQLLAKVIALDPEAEGADYADGMADTLLTYDDEVANVQAALAVDKLSSGGRRVLKLALKHVVATQTAVNAAFGGGE